MTSSVLELRALLERRFPDAVPVTYRSAGAVATGVAALDGVLPGGGFPRGRLAWWVPGGGATAVLRAACEAVVARGERAAWVDGAGVMGGEGWRPGPLLLRPAGVREALECAEELLRCGGFALVVVSGEEVGDGEGVRLSRAVREGGGAGVVLAGGVGMAPLRLVSRIPPNGYRWRRGPFGEPAEVEAAVVRVGVRALGVSAETEIVVPVVGHELRLCLEPGVVDRRGAGV